MISHHKVSSVQNTESEQASRFPLEKDILRGEDSERYKSLVLTLRQIEEKYAALSELGDDRQLARRYFHIAECCRVARKFMQRVSALEKHPPGISI